MWAKEHVDMDPIFPPPVICGEEISVGNSVPPSLPRGQGTFMVVCPSCAHNCLKGKGGQRCTRKGRGHATLIDFCIRGSARNKSCDPGWVWNPRKAIDKSRRQTVGPDFYIENRPLACDSLSATSVYNRACLWRNSGRVVVMSPVFSWSDHRKLERSLWEQMSGWR